MTIDDIQDTQSVLIINIPDTKTGKSRVFTVVAVKNELANDLNLIEIYRKYVSLRSPLTEHRRLFVNYQKSKCTVQPVGINKFAKVPAIIANYLKIPDASSYTGHCWRRTSASLLVHAGADLLTLKSHGGWKSSAVAKGYIENSIQNKISIATKILGNNLAEKPNRIAHVASTSSPVSTQLEFQFMQKIVGEGVPQSDMLHNRTNGLILKYAGEFERIRYPRSFIAMSTCC
jgi:hypothetical protein